MENDANHISHVKKRTAPYISRKLTNFWRRACAAKSPLPTLVVAYIKEPRSPRERLITIPIHVYGGQRRR
jgi:hypothetical protein